MTTTLIALTVLAPQGTSWQQAVGRAMEDEYMAAATYSAVIERFGQVRPFTNIHRAELQHQQMLRVVLDNHKLPIPKDTWAKRKNEPSAEWYKRLGVPDTFKGACDVAVKAEVANIALYDGFFKLELPADVRQAFTKLRDASRDRHLPAFTRCAARG